MNQRKRFWGYFKKINWKAPFRIICWFQEWWYTVRHNTPISGHDYISKYSGYESAFKDLECEICGKISEVKN